MGTSLASAALVIAAVAAAASCSAGASAKRFCGEVGKVPVVSSADQLRGPGGQATLSQLRGALDRLADRAPSDVHADVVTLSKVTGQLQEALARQDEGDEAARDRARAELDGGLSDFAQASQRIVDYTKRTCGVDLSGSTTSTAAGAPNGGATTAPSDSPTTTAP